MYKYLLGSADNRSEPETFYKLHIWFIQIKYFNTNLCFVHQPQTSKNIWITKQKKHIKYFVVFLTRNDYSLFIYNAVFVVKYEKNNHFYKQSYENIFKSHFKLFYIYFCNYNCVLFKLCLITLVILKKNSIF